MRFQSTRSRCGPAALKNSLAARGIHRSEDELASLAKTTSDGTDARGLLRSLAVVNLAENLPPPVLLSESRTDVAALRLMASLRAGNPCILCVRTDEPWDHWVALVGRLGQERVCVVDSGDDELFLVKHITEVMEWAKGPVGHRKPYYGVIT